MVVPLSLLRLIEEEGVVGTVSDVSSDASFHQIKLSLCLIGMVLMKKECNVPAFRATMIHSWKLKKGCVFRRLDENIFVFQFFHSDYKRFLQDEGLWCFDDQLVVLQDMTDSNTPELVMFTECQLWVRAYEVPFRCFSTLRYSRLHNCLVTL